MVSIAKSLVLINVTRWRIYVEKNRKMLPKNVLAFSRVFDTFSSKQFVIFLKLFSYGVRANLIA